MEMSDYELKKEFDRLSKKDPRTTISLELIITNRLEEYKKMRDFTKDKYNENPDIMLLNCMHSYEAVIQELEIILFYGKELTWENQ